MVARVDIADFLLLWVSKFFFPDGSKATKHFTFDGEVAMIIWSYCSFEENDSPLIKHGNGTFTIYR